LKLRDWCDRLAIGGADGVRLAVPPNGPKPLAPLMLPRLMWLWVAIWLTACSAEHFNRPGADALDETLYTSVYPYYAEFCALSQIMKKPGFGADIRGGIGGHSVFYLNGACRDPDTDYPTLHMCDSVTSSTDDGNRVDGVGVSVNDHFSNAKWVAIPGREFFYAGDLPRDVGLTRADYDRTQARAKQLGIYRGVTFHSRFFDDKPADFSHEDYKYEISIATDYAINFGRGRFCARVPVTRAQMVRMIGFLNGQNEPYRNGKEFEWSVFRDNCIHLAHNALAAADVWPERPIDQPLVFAFFNFPVPKNEFVDLMRRTNDPPNLDPSALYHDESAVQSLTQFDQLPWRPGALAVSGPLRSPNEVYDSDVKMIFYDVSIIGRYQGRLDTIFDSPRYFDITRNLQYFAGLYRQIDADRKPIETLLAPSGFQPPAARQRFTEFYQRFYAYVGAQSTVVEAKLAELKAVPRADLHPPTLAEASSR